MQLKALSGMILMATATALLLTACGSMSKVAPGRDKIDYKKSRTTDALEIPPELSSDTIKDAPDSLDLAGTSYSESGAAAQDSSRPAVLPTQENIRVGRDGDQQWLVVQGEPPMIWPRVREFWMQEGFLIRKEDPRVGIIETNWAENRADIPQGPIRNLLGKVMDGAYSAATRDQYRVRLERGTDVATTEVYLTHRGVQEVVTGTAVDADTVWQPRPTDPELEAEMLKRLMVFLGIEEHKAQAELARQPKGKVRAQLVSNETGTLLIIEEGFSRAWRRTGVALDRVGFAVEDRNRTDVIYYVRYSDPLGDQDKEGVLSKLAFWSSDDNAEATQYQIALQGKGPATHVVVNNAAGERETSKTGKRILTLLEEQLK